MPNVNYVNSLMEFNRRVLHTGDLPKDTSILTPEDLKQYLFFNEIFLSNCHEMFQKYDMTHLKEEFEDFLNTYNRNVFLIMNLMCAKYTDINFDNGDSFALRLEIYKRIHNSLITETFELLSEAARYPFDPNIIYYLSPYRKGVSISYIDPRRSIYTDSIYVNENGIMNFSKIDYRIREMISEKNTVATRIITNENTRRISLVEFNGSLSVMKRIVSMFPIHSLIISNGFLYTKDVENFISSKIEMKNNYNCKYEKINLNDYFKKPRLIEYPKDSFKQYLDLLYNAAIDSHTKAIYLTLYRIGDNPEIYYILKLAVENGLYVQVNIELEARGEDINYFWYNEFMKAGIHVTTYAKGKLKVHSKVTLIQFKNRTGIAQIGTGNYHTETTKQYTDLCFITTNSTICHAIENLFKVLNGEERVSFNKNLLVTRYNAKEELLWLIELQGAREAGGYITIKCNGLDDPEIIQKLEWAAHKGCYIDLLVRGVCTWIPDEDLSNVRIKSIIWDKLEHSRVYCFGHTNPTIYIGSLDPISTKLNKRIETLVKIEDPDIMLQICQYLNKYITNTQGWIQDSSGVYYKENKEVY